MQLFRKWEEIMEAREENKNNATKEENAKIENVKTFPIRKLIVLAVLIVFLLFTFISYRAEYLNTIEIGEEYESVFIEKNANKYKVFGVVFFSLYLIVYITNKFIKKGLKKFFEDEKKEIPKLPNKSLSLILALIGAGFASNMLADKFAIFTNAAVFVQTDQIFNADIGYYMFTLPFIQTLIVFIIEVLAVLIIYTALYYVIALNTFFDGVDGETLKKNTFIKQEIFLVSLIVIALCTYIFINSQNILTGEMVTVGEDKTETVLIGAGATEVKLKVWGYRIFSFVLLVAAFGLIKYARKGNFKKAMISALIVPVYLVGFFVSLIYFQIIYVQNNELDNEKQYISYNIENTKKAYGIDIEQKSIDSYSAITSEEVSNNKNVIDNIPLITEDVTLTAVTEHQENSVYYSYDNTALACYNIDNKNKLVYVTPREILTDSTISYNNKTLKYTHGYSAVVSSATDSDNDGYAEYILSSFENENAMNITEPRIYFGLQTNSTIMTNTDFGKEYDYPITATTYEENVYTGEAGLNLNFWNRLVLALSEKNLKLAFSSDINENTKIITNRNIIERAKKILPNVLYDEDPYLVVTEEGRLVWVLDGYTRSNAYPYSQKTTIDIKGYKEEINYIRNSIKVIIDAYDGTTKFYITDRTDPIIMTYSNMYPDLFADENEKIPEDIQAHFIYPKFLYKIQADMINIYHDVSEDVLYRADDIWQITTETASATSSVATVEMEPYYTMLKTNDKKDSTFGLVLTFNKLGKQGITSYLVGNVENGKSKLSLYKFNSESNVIGPVQLNNQIEEDETIAKELETINTSGVKLIKDMFIIPINNTLLYVEPIYQVMLNEKDEIPVLKKVIVASGNTVAIGDNLQEALNNLFNDAYAVDLEFIDTDDIEALIDSVIKANNNLKESLNSNDFSMIGKDISSLQTVVNQLENARKKELEKQDELEKESKVITDETENEVVNNLENDNENLLTNNIQNENMLTNTESNNSVTNSVKK